MYWILCKHQIFSLHQLHSQSGDICSRERRNTNRYKWNVSLLFLISTKLILSTLFSSGTDAATGCLTLTATCTADTANIAFMQFNFNQGGPAENANMGMVSDSLEDSIGKHQYSDN